MRNTQEFWILYVTALILDFLIAKKQRATTKRPGNERGTFEINHSRYSKNALTLKKNQEIHFQMEIKTALEKRFCFCSHRKKL